MIESWFGFWEGVFEMGSSIICNIGENIPVVGGLVMFFLALFWMQICFFFAILLPALVGFGLLGMFLNLRYWGM
jgi:hypothetical protein